MNVQILDACAQLGSGDREGDVLESGITPERILQNMDYAEVSKSVIYPVTWSNYGGAANFEIHQAAKDNPDRFLGFARVNPTSSDAEKILVKAIREWELKGVRLRPFHDRFHLGSPGVTKVLDIARELGIPVGLDGEKDRNNLVKIIRDHPGVPVILCHMGSFDNWDWKNTKAYMDLLEDAENFYLASCFIIIHFFLEEAVGRAPQKVVFGSDSPTLPPSMELKRIETMKLSPEKHAGVVGGNLARIVKA